MQTFTLDTNCIIAIENEEVAAAAVRALARAHAAGDAHVAVVAISASEKPKAGAHLDILRPMLYLDVTFWD